MFHVKHNTNEQTILKVEKVLWPSLSILISIQPYWCNLIVSGRKTVEIRKTCPRLKPPFKCYIYCTIGDGLIRTRPKVFCKNVDGSTVYRQEIMNGKVIGEYICDKITYLGNVSTDPWRYLLGDVHEAHKRLVVENACLTEEALLKYGGKYAWHISNLLIYDQPKELSEFWQPGNCAEDYCIACPHHEVPLGKEPCESCDGNRKYLYRPPQSWCYVKGLAG